MLSITDWFCFVSFDYHHCFVQACVSHSNGTTLGNQRVVNDVSKIIDYVDEIRDGRLIKGAATETCCGASNLTEQLLDKEWPIALAHAGICENMKRSPDKSDVADAHRLADLCRVGYLPSVWLSPKAIRDMRILTRMIVVKHMREITSEMLELSVADTVSACQLGFESWQRPPARAIQWVSLLNSAGSPDTILSLGCGTQSKPQPKEI